MHELLALAFEILHLGCIWQPEIGKKLWELFYKKKKGLESVKYQYLYTSTKEFDELTKDYFLYVSATINREKGKIAEF